MEYYGNLNNKRLMEIECFMVDDVKNPATEIGFIYSKGMLFDYVLDRYYKGTVYEEKWEDAGRHGQKKTTVPIKVKDTKHFIEWNDRWKSMKRIKRNKVFYYVGEYKVYGRGNCYFVYMELPRIEDDKIFTWKYNDKYDTKEAVIKGDVFSFEIIVKPNGNAVIDVRYTKCENKHRNNVTLAQINVYNASNEDILEAIKKWKSNMIQDLRAA